MFVMGLMSGTSLDGIDACLVEVHGVGDRLRYTVRHYLSRPYPGDLRARLVAQLDPAAARLPELAALHVALGEAYAEAVIACCEAAAFPLASLDLVGCHGQTLWHDPKGEFPVSWQLGEPAVVAQRTGVTTVSDFRAADVALGGQGAPLVPYLDWVLFGNRPAPVALQNMGGIGNVTYLPGEARREGRLAFDTGPGNMVVDGLVERLTGGTRHFDEDGRLAAAGTADAALVAAWLARDGYLAEPPPKSTGRERYGARFIDALWADARERGLSDADLLATATTWTAATVADQYRRWLPAERWPAEVLVSGGGARNPVLMRELGRLLAPARVTSTASAGLDPDAKEALAFALLAYQTVAGQPNVLTEATGASAAAVLGQITPGRNFRRALLAAAPPAVQGTESANPESQGLDTLPIEAAVAIMHTQDFQAVLAVGEASAAIAATIADLADRLGRGGRLFYVGAGTSGRLGVLDASECPPTFSVEPGLVVGLIAGGDTALTKAVEGAEDDAVAGAADLMAHSPGPLDLVVGLSANGGAPYVRGALEAARAAGAATGLVTCNPVPAGAFQPDHAIVLPVGPEILAGSTRLKSGTATKLVLNMLTTLTMVRLGKVHDNLMVDVRVSNLKLAGRASRLVSRLTGLAPDDASALLARADGSVKRAAVMHHARVPADEADVLLTRSAGFLRPWLPAVEPAAPVG